MMHIPTWRRALIWLVCLGGLLFALPNLFYDRVERSNDARAVIETGLSDAELQAEAGLWPEWLPSGLVNLGLDLRGGAHLLAEVQVEEVYAARMEAMWPEVRDALAAQRDKVGFVTREEGGDPSELRVRISEASEAATALEIVRGLATPVASLTGGGANESEPSGRGGAATNRPPLP